MSADRIRVLAFECAGIGQNMAFKMLAAVSATLPAETRLSCMADVFFLWPALAERMAELEGLAPRSSAAGYETRERLTEFLARFRDRQLALQTTSSIGEPS